MERAATLILAWLILGAIGACIALMPEKKPRPSEIAGIIGVHLALGPIMTAISIWRIFQGRDQKGE
jgi:hypothetical protein